ncbi:MAG: DUF1987 domain-containing protein [Bacteroidota bacterium]
MEDLFIEGTKKTPKVEFKKDGRLKLSGRSIPEDASRFYDSLYIWIYEYCSNPAQNTVVDIELEYFNSGSSKSVLHILREIVELEHKGKNVTINWYYEEGDDDILERGEYYATILEMDFNFIETE